MQQDEHAFMDDKDYPCWPAGRIGSNLPKTMPKTPSQRHPNGPTYTRCFNVFTDRSLTFTIETRQPLSNRLPALKARVESDPDSR